jgi:hypothetical protein
MELSDSLLGNPIFRVLDVGPFASWAFTRFGKALSITEKVSAFQALCWLKVEPLLLRSEGAFDMGEMIIDFLFPNS